MIVDGFVIRPRQVSWTRRPYHHDTTLFDQKSNQDQRLNQEPKTTTTRNENDDNDDDSPLGSLESVLTKARKRTVVAPMYKVQTLWNRRLFQLTTPSLPFPSSKKPISNPTKKDNVSLSPKTVIVFTGGDFALILAAILIHANGFALGLLLAKWTEKPFRNIFQPPESVQIVLMPLWPVVWAIGLDQIL